MSQALRGLSPTALDDLAAAIDAGTVSRPFNALLLRRLGVNAALDVLAAELTALVDLGMSPPALARTLTLLAEERRAAQGATDRTELVWTGPETRGSRTRDTSVIVRELFSTAEQNVLVSSYAVYDGQQVFEPLTARMDALPALQVRVFLNVARPNEGATETQILKDAATTFRRFHWSGKRLPELYYDPRSLAVGGGDKAVLHAKAIVVDDARAFVTSANFTEAAHERNIEAGVLVSSPAFAASLRLQFEALVEVGKLRRLSISG